ncbi:hypothetical protein EJB05_11952, partial [Eragrostis curvula]
MVTQICSIRSHLETTASARQLPALTEDLLEEIFIRIACPSDLACASAASVDFRRLITDRTFLRRYHSRHPPLLLGFLNLDVAEGFYAIEAPHPNATAAGALGNISFDFLPPPRVEDWYISDVRDGLILLGLMKHVEDTYFYLRYPMTKIVSNILMLPLPPCVDEDDEKFRVIGMMYYETNLVVLVFDSASGSWTTGTCCSWDVVNSSIELAEWSLWMSLCMFLGYAYGCFYWKDYMQNKLLKLDIQRMEFSTINLPPGHENLDVFVVEAGNGRLGIYNDWQVKNVIPLPVYEDFGIYEGPQGYVFIQGDLEGQDSKRTTIYSLDIKTLKFEMVTQMSYHFEGRPYFGFPPSISPRRI